jgi:tetratricopeptide (TPR) repeat protein
VSIRIRLAQLIQYLVAALAIAGALPALRAAQNTQPAHDPKATNEVKLGIELKKKGDAVGAMGHYREAIRLDPRYAEAHYNYAIALAERGDRDTAVSEYKKAIEIDKNYAEAHFNLALLLRQKGDREGEIKEYRRAIEAAPNYAKAHFNLANALVEQGDYDGAIDQYQNYLNLVPKAPDAEQVKQMVKKLRGQKNPT